MIYFLEFFKGLSFGIMLFGAFWLFYVNDYSLFYLFLGAVPGFILSAFSFLLIENYELREKIKL